MSLYERLGGVYAIAAVVDDFIDRIMGDPRLNANPKVQEAHHRVSRAGFKYLVTEQVCQAFLDDLRQTLDRFNVPSAERAELFAIVESTRNDIVLEPKP